MSQEIKRLEEQLKAARKREDCNHNYGKLHNTIFGMSYVFYKVCGKCGKIQNFPPDSKEG